MSKAQRKSISQRMRFEIFKRDSFTCQYCGKSAPDVVLEVDHIEPVSKGGKTVALNLVTSCYECNRGKSNIKLSDNSVVEKQKRAVAELAIKQEQLKMLLKWRSELLKIEDQEMTALTENWSRLSGYELNDSGIHTLKKTRREFGFAPLLEAMDISSKYFEYKDGKVTQDSVEYAFNKVKGICYMRSLPEEKRNEYQQIGKLKYYIKNKFYNCNEKWVAIYIGQFIRAGNSIDLLKEIIDQSDSYKEWELQIKDFIHGV